MTGLHTHVERLARGTTAMGRRACRVLDCPRRERLYRSAAALLGAWMLGGMVLATPGILWALVTAWGVAAWRSGRAIERQRAAEAALVQYVRDRIGGRNGVLLADVLAGLHAAGMHPDWDVTALRGVVERLGIVVRDSLKVDGTVSVGVHIDDLTDVWDVHPTPPPVPSGTPSPGAVTSDNYPTTSPEEKPPGEGQEPDEETLVERLDAVMIAVARRREQEYEDHLADALDIVREAKGRGQ